MVNQRLIYGRKMDTIKTEDTPPMITKMSEIFRLLFESLFSLERTPMGPPFTTGSVDPSVRVIVW